MKIPINRRLKKAVYVQIHDHLCRLINSGALKEGDRLPSVRVLSKETNVNKLTVMEAYNLLEAEGLIVAHQGSGYFVNKQRKPSLKTNSSFAPEQGVIIPKEKNHSFVEVYQTGITAKSFKDLIDFSDSFPLISDLEDIQKIARRAMNGITQTLFHYDYAQGQLTLRTHIVQLLLQQGLQIGPDNIIVTNGSNQALSLCVEYFLKEGDWAIVESPTYNGAIDILENRGVKIIGIPMTSEGINLELLEQYLESHRPKLIYTITTNHNPTGITTSLSHRQHLLTLATRYQCQVLEDNAYEGLNFDPAPPPLFALDKEDLVTYLGTFSKTLMPGLRVGYMVVTQKHYQGLLEKKLLHDFHVSTVSQAIVSEYLASGHYRRHLHRLRESNLINLEAMLSALENYFPSSATWTVPNGGLFLWVHLSPDTDLDRVIKDALAQKVFVVSGETYFPGKAGYKAMRLNFSHSVEIIEQGIKILGSLL